MLLVELIHISLPKDRGSRNTVNTIDYLKLSVELRVPQWVKLS